MSISTEGSGQWIASGKDSYLMPLHIFSSEEA